MVVEIIRYNIAAGQETAFEKAYGEAQRYLAGSDNCFGYQLMRCVEEPNRYILRIEWDSLEGHMRGFRGSPEFSKFFALVQPFFGAVEEMQHYEETDIVSGK